MNNLNPQNVRSKRNKSIKLNVVEQSINISLNSTVKSKSNGIQADFSSIIVTTSHVV